MAWLTRRRCAHVLSSEHDTSDTTTHVRHFMRLVSFAARGQSPTRLRGWLRSQQCKVRASNGQSRRQHARPQLSWKQSSTVLRSASLDRAWTLKCTSPADLHIAQCWHSCCKQRAGVPESVRQMLIAGCHCTLQPEARVAPSSEQPQCFLVPHASMPLPHLFMSDFSQHQ